MKTKIIFVIITILFISCTHAQKKTIDESSQDISSQKCNDEYVAFGDAKFGMTLNELINTEIFKKAELFTVKVSSYTKMIWEEYSDDKCLWTEYTFRPGIDLPVYGFSFEDKLYCLNILSLEDYSQTSDAISSRYGAMVESIKAKYGPPVEYYSKSYLSPSDFEYLSAFPLYIWEIGEKRIEVMAYNTNGRYMVVCKIYNTKYYDIVQQAKLKQKSPF